MRQHRDLVLAMLDDHAIADGRIGIRRARRVIANALDDFDDGAVGRRADIAAERVVILVLRAVAPHRLPIRAHAHQVQREALVWHFVVAVELGRVPAPEDPPTA